MRSKLNMGEAIGNDTLIATVHSSADVYVFNRGDGQDTIDDATSGPGLNNKLAFGVGVADQDLWFSRSNNHLLVQALGEGGRYKSTTGTSALTIVSRRCT